MLKHRRSRSKPELSAEQLLAEINDDPTIRSRSNLKILSDEPKAPVAPVVSTPTVVSTPPVEPVPPVRSVPTVGPTAPVGYVPSLPRPSKAVRPIRFVQDALTATAFIVYDRMYGAADGSALKICAMGYSELARETGRHKDLVRDIIVDLKQKGIVREIEKYDADTRKPKKYEVLSFSSALQLWREAGIGYVTKARRPMFCDSQGNEISFVPTVGPNSTAGTRPTAPPVGLTPPVVSRPGGAMGTAPLGTVGATPTLLETTETKREKPSSLEVKELREYIQTHIGLIDEEAAQRLVVDCKKRAGKFVSATEIIAVVSGKLAAVRKARNPVGLLIEAIPKNFPLPVPPIAAMEASGEGHSVDDRIYWEKVLVNEDAPEALKREAKRLLS